MSHQACLILCLLCILGPFAAWLLICAFESRRRLHFPGSSVLSANARFTVHNSIREPRQRIGTGVNPFDSELSPALYRLLKRRVRKSICETQSPQHGKMGSLKAGGDKPSPAV